jgi:hypothetical protein
MLKITKQFWIGFIVACILWYAVLSSIEIPEYVISNQTCLTT